MKSIQGRFLKNFSFLPPKTTLRNTLISHHKFGISPFNLPDNTTQIPDKPNTAISYEEVDQENTFLSHFQEKCPPGGTDSVILYTTSLRSIRKTFEDCNAIRFLLQSFKVKFFERDVSMDLEFREELWRILGGRVIPPKLFIRGRYIGGADEVVSLHEQGKLKNLLHGMPQNLSIVVCSCCSNQRFLVCSTCHGCRKLFPDGDTILQDQLCIIRCPDCNENGLVKCRFCC